VSVSANFRMTGNPSITWVREGLPTIPESRRQIGHYQVSPPAGGGLDVLMHNAGHMVFGPAEAFTPEQLAELYDINVLRTQRVNRIALPQMRIARRKIRCSQLLESLATLAAT
jgi:NAD(P)-dependent dehydrogenase (short-subunit alcohol dehydrogenase family)